MVPSPLGQRNLKAGFTLKTHQMFSVHITPEKSSVKNATISGDFGFVFEENSGRENQIIIVIDYIIFEKFPFQNVFRPRENEKRAFPKSSTFEAPFS